MTCSRSSLPRLLLCAALLLALVALSLCLGRYPAPGLALPRLPSADPLGWRLFWMLRVPRVLSALLLGTALAASGTVLQMLFRNPLVEPGFLGVSQGAALGAGTAILLGAGAAAIQLSAALAAMLGLALSYLLATRIRHGSWLLRLLLAGIAISAIFSAGLGLLKSVADPLRTLPDLTFWLMGGLWSSSWTSLARFTPVLLPALLLIWLMRWRLALLALGDETAHSLGVAARTERLLLLAAAAAATASVVAVAGIVGWIGLLIPHIARRLLGADPRRALPGALLLGAFFALLCDDLARALAPTEIPLGILTSLFGAILFLAIMARPDASPARAASAALSPSPVPVPDSGLPPSPGPGPALAAADLTFAYAPDLPPVLRSLALDIPSAVPTALLGANGSGKTTLLRLLLGLRVPSAGTITLFGRPLAAYSRRHRATLLGLVPQSETVPFDFPLLDYVLLGRAPHLSPLALPGPDDLAAARAALAATGLSHLADRPVTRLSGGELQLATLARALAQAPALLLLDEPTAHLDLANRRAVQDVLARLAAAGTTLVFTTHDPALALALARHVLLLKDGALLAAGPAPDLLTSDLLTRTFSIPVSVTSTPPRPVILA